MKKESFYIYGKKPVEEQLMHNPINVMRVFISDTPTQGDPQEFVVLKKYAKDHNIPINAISRNKIKDYVGDVNAQGVIALLNTPEYTDFETWQNTLPSDILHSVLVLDHVEDTHNFGAILRTAVAVGVSGVIVAKDHQAPINGTVFKTSAGALTKIPVIQVSNINQAIDKLKNKGFWTAAIDMDDNGDTQTIWNQTFDTSMAFIVGAEGKGVSQKTREHADFILSIPMENDVESLNVSVATAIVLYEWKRQQSL